MNCSLNYDSSDPKFILLKKVLDFMNSKKSLNALSRAGVSNRRTVLFYIEILFIAMYFSCPISHVVDELNRSAKLRKFVGIEDKEISVAQVYEGLSRSTAVEYCNYVNSILKIFNKTTRGKYNKYIVDATPSACDFNIDKKYITKEHLEKLKLNWGYSTTKGHFIGFKVTVVLNYKTLSPVSILIHSGAPNDSKLFDEILQELKRRRLIKYKDIIYFDKGYYSLNNYSIGVNKYKIVPVIFPKSSFSLDKLKNQMALPLEAYNKTKYANSLKNDIKSIASILYEKLENWKDYKPVRGIIEDFFKVAKDAFGLGKFHSYTVDSMSKNIYFCLLLTTIVVQQGYKTKTKLQRLAEGNVVQDTPVKKKSKKKKDKNKNKDDNTDNEDKQGQQKLNIEFESNRVTLFNYAET